MIGLKKWQRKYILQIEGTDGKTYEISSNPDLLTLEISIVRNNLASANIAHFRLYNLNRDTRDAIFKDYFTPSDFRAITLRAGYETEPVLPIIFNGNLKSVQSFREEGMVNVITEIEAYDFSFAMSNSYSSWNKKAGASKQDVVNSLANDIVQNGRVNLGKISEFPGDHPRGFVAMGNTWSLLQTETEKHCYIDNGKLYCLQDTDCIAGDIAEISSDTGLLGSPRRYESYLKAEMLFEPRLNVGQQVRINSQAQKRFNGTYKITGIAHQGVISDAVSGKCKTIVSILLGSFQTI
jgi:hypothetical protein